MSKKEYRNLRKKPKLVIIILTLMYSFLTI